MSEDIQKQIRSLRNEDQSGRTTYDYRKQCNRAADSLKSLLAEVKSVTRQARTMTEALTKIAGGSYDNLAGDPSLWASSIAGKGLSDAVSGSQDLGEKMADEYLEAETEHMADRETVTDDSSPTPCEWCNGTGKRDCGDPSNGLIDCTHCSTADDSKQGSVCEDCGEVVDDLLEHCEREDNICLIRAPAEKGQATDET